MLGWDRLAHLVLGGGFKVRHTKRSSVLDLVQRLDLGQLDFLCWLWYCKLARRSSSAQVELGAVVDNRASDVEIASRCTLLILPKFRKIWLFVEFRQLLAQGFGTSWSFMLIDYDGRGAILVLLRNDDFHVSRRVCFYLHFLLGAYWLYISRMLVWYWHFLILLC